MIWRVAAFLAVLFWAMMSGLLVRDVYFPEASRFAMVPPRVVIDLFLRQSDSFGSQLHLYHHREKIGHASFQISQRIKPNHQAVHDILARGVVEQMEDDGRRQVAAAWNVACILADAERWQHLEIRAEFPERNASMKLAWGENEAAPEVLVKQGERVLMNSQDMKMILGAGDGGAMAMLSLFGGGGLAKLGERPKQTALSAREGVMMLAGRQRKCFVLTLPVIGPHEVKMLFTEAGELARIDLPDGYSLLEPTIHGLQDNAH